MKKIKILLESINRDFLSLVPFIEENINSLKQQDNCLEAFSEQQTVLITYADQFQNDKQSHLKSLDEFLTNDMQNLCSHVHILPFYPWTSDDGFGPNNYHEVSEEYGTWEDIDNIHAHKMFDCVFNHLSSQSDIFQKALKGDWISKQMFHTFSEDEYNDPMFQHQMKIIVRPRTSPLLTPYDFNGETRYVWTTFSADQVDTNLDHPEMMKYILESFFLYIEKGAKFFRIDAVPFLWKKLGSNCSHLHKTHLVVQLFRAIVDAIGSDLLIITESNVPHFENISYFGTGANEAHVVYNFSLAPLVLHALTFKTSHWINEWIKDVFDIPKGVTYLNFTATHDGIGMRGLEGLVPEVEVEMMCDATRSLNGRVGMKQSRSGEEKPYELNITWASYLESITNDIDLHTKLVVNSHAFVMFFPGIAAHYVHNFFGTQSWIEGRELTGVARTVNRKKLKYPLSLNDKESKVFTGLKEWIKLKSARKCFHPKADIELLSFDDRVISFKRTYKNESAEVYFNITAETLTANGHKLEAFDLLVL